MSITPKRKKSARTEGIESLELRALLSAVAVTLSPASDPADTLDQATPLGSFDSIEVNETIGDNGQDVDWYTFTLAAPTAVTLTGFDATVSLYNDARGTVMDLLSTVGQRQLLQFTAADGIETSATRELAAGTYYVAVSGAGNLHFHSLIAHSGLGGATGNYTLQITSAPLELSASVDPVVLSADATPIAVWIGLSGQLDFAPLVQITDANGLNYPVARVVEALNGTELQVLPSAPLPAGTYQLAIKDLSGDVRLSGAFTVSEVFAAENGSSGNDTPATALEFGTIDNAGLIQSGGFIGDDATYQLGQSNAALFGGNDVDLYHFHISSSTPLGFRAEVFATRTGSALNAGLSLYRLDAATGDLVYVSGMDNSYNRLAATDGTRPLYWDPILITGLAAGDYYLAVTQSANTVSPLEGLDPAFNPGLPDPAVAHSGTRGLGIGQYFLNLEVGELGNSPEVVSVSIGNQAVLPAAPTGFSVRFDEYMNLTEPAFVQFMQYSQSSIEGIYIRDAQGNKYFPELQGFNAATFEAQFQMARRLPAGSYELHLNGNRGVTNLAGMPVAGNTPGGDYVVKFTVAQNAVGTGNNPVLWTHDPQTDITPSTQELGVLFPDELRAGVAIVRPSGSASNQIGDTSDSYSFKLTQPATYQFILSGNSLPAGVTLTLLDQAGNTVPGFSPDGLALFSVLRPGEYTIQVSGWASTSARRLNYRLEIAAPFLHNDAPPLSVGPSPTFGLRLSSVADGGGGSGSFPGVITPGRPSGGSGTGDQSGSDSHLGGTARSTSPGYLSIRNGLTQSSISDDNTGIVIAIPTETSAAIGTAGGFRIQRAGGRSAGLKDPLPLRGLSGLADAPMGRLGRSGGLDASLTGRRLSDLVKISLSGDPHGISERTTAHTAAPTGPRTDGSDQLDASQYGDAVTVDDRGSEPGPDSSAQSANQTGGDEPGKTASRAETNPGADQPKRPDTPVAFAESLLTTDTVFAAGLGLLMSELWIFRDRGNPAPIKPVAPKMRRGTWRNHSQLPMWKEESVS